MSKEDSVVVMLEVILEAESVHVFGFHVKPLSVTKQKSSFWRRFVRLKAIFQAQIRDTHFPEVLVVRYVLTSSDPATL